MQAFRHAPFWCEENAWHLAQDPRPGGGERLIAIVTGVGGLVAMWKQRAATAEDLPVGWDYHVLLFVRGDTGWSAWDLDSTLGLPVPAAAWIDGSFPCPHLVPPALQPRFRLVPAPLFVAGFATDRSHMRAADGGWRQPPPPWPPPGGGTGMTLHAWLAPDGGIGEILDLDGIRHRLR